MPRVLEEFITLTPLTCVQQVNALLDATSSKPRSCKVLYTLFGVYCGVLAYRAYRSYWAKRAEVAAAQVVSVSPATEVKVEETELVPADSFVSAQIVPEPEPVPESAPAAPTPVPAPILLQPSDFSTTDMRWRYGPQTVPVYKQGSESNDEEEEPFEKPINISNEEPEVATVSVGTSTMGKRVRTCENQVEEEPPKATTFTRWLDD